MTIFAEFRQALGALRCVQTQGLARSGISMTQVQVLTLLEHHGEMPMSRLAEMLGVSFSNATGLIDRMEEHGLVERIRDGADRRIVNVRPSPRGREAVQEVQLMRDDMMRRLLGRLDPAQLARIEAGMADMRIAILAEADSAIGGHEHQHPHPQSRGIDQ